MQCSVYGLVSSVSAFQMRPWNKQLMSLPVIKYHLGQVYLDRLGLNGLEGNSPQGLKVVK